MPALIEFPNDFPAAALDDCLRSEGYTLMPQDARGIYRVRPLSAAERLRDTLRWLETQLKQGATLANVVLAPFGRPRRG